MTQQKKNLSSFKIHCSTTGVLWHYFSLILELSFKQLTIGIWSGKSDGPLLVVTAMGVTLILKFCQLLVRNYNKKQWAPSLSPSPFISALISHSSQSVTFFLDATGWDFSLLLEPMWYNTTLNPAYELIADCYPPSGKVADVV